MAKLKWYDRPTYKITPNTLRVHNGRLDGETWEFLERITEEELIFLGTGPLKIIQQKWTEQRDRIADMAQLYPVYASELAGRDRVLQYIDHLLSQAAPKPAIPQLRNREWVHEGDAIYLCITDFWRPEDVSPAQIGDIIKGVAIEYQGKKYNLALELDRNLPNLCYRDRCTGSDYRSALIIRCDEYDYLKKHPDFAKIWLKYFDSIRYPFGCYVDGYAFWEKAFSN